MQEFIDALLGRDLVAPGVISAEVVVFNLVVTAALAIIIAQTYKHVHKGISYSQSYVYSIVLVSMVVALAMMVIGSDITRAFALLGTFTIIRYRTAVKDPKDTAFIFIALVVGLAAGSSNYGIAISGTLVMSLMALFLDWINFGAAKKLEQVMYLTVDADKVDQSRLEKFMLSAFRSSKLLNVNYINEGNKMLYSYNVTLRKDVSSERTISAIRKIKGIETAEILTSQNLVEF